jgi:hypothetical protein
MADVELTTADCLCRYLYVTTVNEGDDRESDPTQRISRFPTVRLLQARTQVLLRFSQWNKRCDGYR